MSKSKTKPVPVRVHKEIQRTRGVVVESDIDESSTWTATIEDFLITNRPERNSAGSEVTVRLHTNRGGAVTTTQGDLRIPVAAWPALRVAVDKVIEEFQATYPESPQ